MSDSSGFESLRTERIRLSGIVSPFSSDDLGAMASSSAILFLTGKVEKVLVSH